MNKQGRANICPLFLNLKKRLHIKIKPARQQLEGGCPSQAEENTDRLSWHAKRERLGNGQQEQCVAAPENSMNSAMIVDMRSDTVTKPTIEMIQACAEAEVDDDVQGRDPTTKMLEEYTAQLFGKEDAIFLPSGTMANLIAVMTHCPERGSEFIVGSKAHIYIYEQGGSAQVALCPRRV